MLCRTGTGGARSSIASSVSKEVPLSSSGKKGAKHILKPIKKKKQFYTK